jgi:putative hydrolase of HD superfamily
MKIEREEKTFEASVLSLFERIHPLDLVQRAGYVLRGIASPETVSAHSHFVTLLTLLFADRYPESFDGKKALAMAIIHDLPEAILMDIPMPASDAFLKDAKKTAETGIFESLFADFGGLYSRTFRELQDLSSDEAKLVAGLDKAQMMIKILFYQKEGRGRLDEFWRNPAHFRDYGIEPVSRLFDEICRRAGKARPRV